MLAVPDQKTHSSQSNSRAPSRGQIAHFNHVNGRQLRHKQLLRKRLSTLRTGMGNFTSCPLCHCSTKVSRGGCLHAFEGLLPQSISRKRPRDQSSLCYCFLFRTEFGMLWCRLFRSYLSWLFQCRLHWTAKDWLRSRGGAMHHLGGSSCPNSILTFASTKHFPCNKTSAVPDTGYSSRHQQQKVGGH